MLDICTSSWYTYGFIIFKRLYAFGGAKKQVQIGCFVWINKFWLWIGAVNILGVTSDVRTGPIVEFLIIYWRYSFMPEHLFHLTQYQRSISIEKSAFGVWPLNCERYQLFMVFFLKLNLLFLRKQGDTDQEFMLLEVKISRSRLVVLFE